MRDDDTQNALRHFFGLPKPAAPSEAERAQKAMEEVAKAYDQWNNVNPDPHELARQIGAILRGWCD